MGHPAGAATNNHPVGGHYIVNNLLIYYVFIASIACFSWSRKINSFNSSLSFVLCKDSFNLLIKWILLKTQNWVSMN